MCADLALIQCSAGQAIAQEIIQTVSAEPRQGPLQERIPRVVVEVGRLVAQLLEPGRKVRPVEHPRLEALVVVLLLRGHQEIHSVRERRVRNVVQEPGNLLLAAGAQPSQKDMNTQTVLEPRHVLKGKGDR